MLKWIGIILMIGTGTLAGYSESLKLKQRVCRLEEFLRFLQAAETEMRFSASPLQKILEKHGKEFPFMQECLLKMEAGEPFASAWEASLKKAEHTGFSKTDTARLREFGAGWGATDIQGQLKHCDLSKALLEAQLREARQEKETKARLYQMLGIFGGIAAAILLG